MEKKLIKKDVDNAIRITKKYYRSSDSDYLEALGKAEEKAFGDERYWVSSLLSGVTCKDIQNYAEPYETYYKVLEDVGFEIVEGEEDA